MYFLLSIVFFEHAICSVWDPLKNSLRNVKLESQKTYESVRQGEILGRQSDRKKIQETQTD